MSIMEKYKYEYPRVFLGKTLGKQQDSTNITKKLEEVLTSEKKYDFRNFVVRKHTLKVFMTRLKNLYD